MATNVKSCPFPTVFLHTDSQVPWKHAQRKTKRNTHGTVWLVSYLPQHAQACQLLVFNAQPAGMVISRRSRRPRWPCGCSLLAGWLVGWLVGWLTSQQGDSVYQGLICSDKCTCCHTEIEGADQACYLTQPQYTDTGPTSPSADPVTPGAWQGSHWSANFSSHWYDSTRKNPVASGIRARDLPLSRRTP